MNTASRGLLSTAALLLAACGTTPSGSTEADPASPTGGALDDRREPIVSSVTPGGLGAVESPASANWPALSPSLGTRLLDDALVETSGLAISRRDSGVLWAINDGGHAPALHALTFDGRPLGRWPLDVINRDWEDMAAFRIDGEPYLLIADSGDNARRLDEIVLHVVAEPVARGPDAAPGTPLVVERSLRVRYEDGPHDVEAVAVDETSGVIWLLPKEPVADGRGVAGGAYTLPLPGRLDPVRPDEPLLARRATTLAPVSRGLVERLAASVTGVDLEQPTAFDIAADGRRGCLLTYRRIRCFERADGEDWSETLSRPGTALSGHDLDQAEALAVAADGSRLLFTSEGAMPPLRARVLPAITP